MIKCEFHLTPERPKWIPDGGETFAFVFKDKFLKPSDVYVRVEEGNFLSGRVIRKSKPNEKILFAFNLNECYTTYFDLNEERVIFIPVTQTGTFYFSERKQ